MIESIVFMFQSSIVRPSMVVAAACALTGVAGCSSETDANVAPVGQSSAPLIQAPLDTDHPFDVGICHGTLNTDGTCTTPGKVARCSGTLVAPNLVLTARHCVNQVVYPASDSPYCAGHFTSDPTKPGGTHVTTAPSVKVGSPAWIDVERVITSSSDDSSCDGDVALLVLSQDIDDVKPVRWVDLRTDLREHPPCDRRVAIVGRGVINYALDPTTLAPVGVDDGNLMRRILRDIPFVCAGASCSAEDITSPPSDVQQLTAGTFLVAPSGLPGDSGSGVLSNIDLDSRSTVIGVSTANTWAHTGQTSGGMAVRLAPHARWIAEAVFQAAKEGAYRVPAWAY